MQEFSNLKGSEQINAKCPSVFGFDIHCLYLVHAWFPGGPSCALLFLGAIENCWCCVWALFWPAHQCVIWGLCDVIYAQCVLSCNVTRFVSVRSDVSLLWNMLLAYHDNGLHGVHSACQPGIITQGAYWTLFPPSAKLLVLIATTWVTYTADVFMLWM